MRLTTFTDYSLRVLIYLAAAPGHRSTIAEVASAFAISEHHLVKVVQRLGREGFLLNTRGRGGGMQLARPAREINIGDVVRATEGVARPAECFEPDASTCSLSGICRAQRALADAVASFYAALDRYTLEDLCIPAPELTAALQRHPAPTHERC